jgi:hypothetical protein
VRRFAEGTPVTVDKSRGEISGILAQHGCMTMAWGTTPTGDTLQFALGGHLFRFSINKPTPEEMRERDGERYTYPHNIDWKTKATDEWRRRWRAHVLLIKAKLEFIEGGDTTLELEFMPYTVLKSGETLGEWMEAGGVPLLTAG